MRLYLRNSNRSIVLLQDIIKDDEIKLDLFFKASLIYDLVKVPSVIMLIKLTILYDIYKRINYTKPIYLYSQGMQQRERKKRRKKTKYLHTS